MKKQNFIAFLQSQSNIALSEFFCQKLNDFIATAETKELEALSIQLLQSKKRFINDSDFIEILKFCFWERAKDKAKTAKIAKYKGSRYEEKYLLAMYFYKKEVKEKGLEWIL